jgi:hypothetical protein
MTGIKELFILVAFIEIGRRLEAAATRFMAASHPEYSLIALIIV